MPPGVSVVIPFRNEESDLPGAIRSVLRQTYPQHAMELVLVDGASEDGSVDRATEVLEDAGQSRFSVVSSPRGTTPANLNAGLARASGTYLCRVDARSRLPSDYVARCVEIMESRPEVRVVGGAQVAVPRDSTVRAGAIAAALNNPLTMGGSRYRRGASSGPADTVYLGFFRTSDLRRAGGWDERLHTNQDFELNRRMARSGVVWFESGLAVAYLPRETMTGLFRQYHRFGRWKVRYWRMTRDRPRLRQVVLLAAPLVAAATIVSTVRHVPARIGAGLAAVAITLGWRSRLTTVATLATSLGWTTGVWREAATGTAEPTAPDAGQ